MSTTAWVVAVSLYALTLLLIAGVPQTITEAVMRRRRPKFAKGGLFPSGERTVRFVAIPAPDGGGSLDLVYADECIIGTDRVCRRRDRMHADQHPLPPGISWVCPSRELRAR